MAWWCAASPHLEKPVLSRPPGFALAGIRTVWRREKSFRTQCLLGVAAALIDRVHPELHDEIKHAKDAAAGAVLLAGLFAACVGVAMLASLLL